MTLTQKIVIGTICTALAVAVALIIVALVNAVA